MSYLEDLEIAWQMENTAEKIKVLERAIASADMYNDLPNSIEAREILIDTCMEIGFPKKQLQAFSWLVKKWEDDEEDIDTYDMLWKYKWISESIPTFEEVSKKQVDTLLQDMKAKFEQYNYSLRPYYKVTTLAAMRMGDTEKAKQFFGKWHATKADYLNDCGACETNDQAHYYCFAQDYKTAVKVAKPIIKGKQRCAEVPHLTYGNMALAYLELGDEKMAQECFDKGYPLVKNQGALISSLANLLTFLVRTEQVEKAREVIDANKETALQSESGLDRLLFLQAAYPLFDKETEADLIELTKSLTAKFDARNENNYYSERLM
ncbi:hypothetical protein [Listeria ivanovii]|uniref:hypothetical protein n=1 Tax=Listeria ivanovii TaxID=1638 RepID=UPI001941EF22|nr:hypothetical protein [Listeria ivanovii]MBM5635453.1 hypothetical protein [Listeria ivanovii]MBM5704880.1 hypothetical protein [Listeria ivanovii]